MKLEKTYSLDKLSQYVDGDEEQIKEMIKLFLDSIPVDINELPKLSEKGDWQSIYKIAHKVKPSFDVFAMDDVLIDIKNIELLARSNNHGGNLVLCIQKFMTKFNAIVSQLQAEIE